MHKLMNKLPTALIELLNSFNNEIANLNDKVILKTEIGKRTLVKVVYEQILISYEIKSTDDYFMIEFIPKKDIIGWKYFPKNKMSSNGASVNLTAGSPNLYASLLSALNQWNVHVAQRINLENPLIYFDSDRFIRFYSAEILNEIKIKDSDKNYPVPFHQQEGIIEQLKVQTELLDSQIKISEDNPEKLNDLKVSKEIAEKMIEELPRMTIEEVKVNWSLSLGGVLKWCGDKLLNVINLDSKNGNNISRSLGSFIGGLLGVPKIE